MDKDLKYCREWKLKCNLEKAKILVCKKGGNLRKDERWCPKDRTPETGVVTLENCIRDAVWGTNMGTEGRVEIS
jgi:hypothetical protein